MDRLIEVGHKEGDLFEIAVRGHMLHVDQPIEDGGGDMAPTPTELFVASLASCVAFYARRFLARHDLPTAGLAVTATYAMADRPARVGEIKIALTVPQGVPVGRQAALLAVARHCTVHNTLGQPPDVRIDLAA
jgi:putative redox protein